MTDADLYEMLREAEERQRSAAEAEAYARGERDALRKVFDRLRRAVQPVPAAPEAAPEAEA